MKNTTCGDARAMATPARAIATRRWVIGLGILTTTLLTGCVTATGRGEAALESGRYGEAATRFEEALAGKPGSLDALVGLGIAKYRLGALDEAQRALTEHVERALRALAGGAVSAEMRQYMAGSIEDQSAWAGELDATRQALAHSELRRITDDRTLLLLPRACQCR